jgi:hypothetical protein
LTVVVSLASLAGCGGGSAAPDADVAANVIINCNASDEAWLAMKDLVDTGATTTSDTRAAALTAPADGAVLPAATPPTFTWSIPAPLRHGIDTGTFVWLRFTGAGLAAPVDVISVTPTTAPDGGTADCAAYTPSAADWAVIAAATGPVTVEITTAKEDQNVVTQGPFRPSASTITFTVGP